MRAPWWHSSSSSSSRASTGCAASSDAAELDSLFPSLEGGADPVPARVLHNAPGRYRPITDAIARLLESAADTLDVVNPYVTDRRMIRRIEQAARRGVRVRLFVPANANNWACAGAQQFHHAKLLDAGVRILEYPTMLHAKAFVRDGEELLAGTCNLEAWSLKRFFEIDLQLRSTAVAAQFDERFSAPAEAVSAPGRLLTGAKATGQGRGTLGDLPTALSYPGGGRRRRRVNGHSPVGARSARRPPAPAR